MLMTFCKVAMINAMNVSLYSAIYRYDPFGVMDFGVTAFGVVAFG